MSATYTLNMLTVAELELRIADEERSLAELAPYNGTAPGADAISKSRARRDAARAELLRRSTIAVVTLGSLVEGDDVAHVDDDTLTTETVNADYVAADQEWFRVIGTSGHADVGSLRLRNLHGRESTHTVDWSGKVWKRVAQ